MFAHHPDVGAQRVTAVLFVGGVAFACVVMFALLIKFGFAASNQATKFCPYSDVVDVNDSVFCPVIVVGFKRYGWMEELPIVVPTTVLLLVMVTDVPDNIIVRLKNETLVALEAVTAQVPFSPVFPLSVTPAIVIRVFNKNTGELAYVTLIVYGALLPV